MAENSKIEWTHHTFNPWRGCTKVSDGCTNCYAEKMSGRNPNVLGVWGKYGTRVVASESMWKQPLKWDFAAMYAKPRHRVFCASLADVFEAEDTLPSHSIEPILNARLRLLELIFKTPNLDWLLLTKRPENIRKALLGAVAGNWADPGDVTDRVHAWMAGERIPHNVWIGTSVEDQKTADERIPHLLKIPAKVRFISMEPLLGPVDLRNVEPSSGQWLDAVTGLRGGDHSLADCNSIDWAIVGGESGGKARPFDISWARSILDQCKAASVPVFLKQLGAKVLGRECEHGRDGKPCSFEDRKGGDWNEWPDDLRVRELPNAA